MKDFKVILAVTLMLFCAFGCAACGMSRDSGRETTPPPETTPAPLDVTSDTAPETTTDAIAASGELFSRGLEYTSNGDGSCTLIGMGSCTDSCLIIPDTNEQGERVSAIAAGALEGNAQINAVQLPAGVVSIGEGAFAGCSALTYISVDPENTAYTEIGGVLYTADQSKLICIPAGGSLTTLNVTLKLRQIVPRASEGATALNKIMFEGTEAQWKCIVIGDGNAPISAIVPICMRQAGK